MTKTEAISIFGGRQLDVAEALGVTASRVSQMPEDLDQATTDRVIGAAVRLGLKLPPHLLIGSSAPPPPSTTGIAP